MTKDSIQLLQDFYKTNNVSKIEDIQSLWSGYGMISRFKVESTKESQVVVKHIDLSENKEHPKGWNTSTSHLRKVKSYEVESKFYELYSLMCAEECKVPKFIHSQSNDHQSFIVLEDLNAIGYSERKTSLSIDEVKSCLKWLANFHATYLDIQPDNLWQQGSYWHLDTRPDEFFEMDDLHLKMYARDIDLELKNAQFKTIIHGDAKLANFCFSIDAVAAVDFQYVGGGVGVTDVAYFLGSCLNEEEQSEFESELLNYYFDRLKENSKNSLKAEELTELETEWRRLYNWCIADFCRFLNGWSPGHKKNNSYTESRTQSVLIEIESR